MSPHAPAAPARQHDAAALLRDGRNRLRGGHYEEAIALVQPVVDTGAAAAAERREAKAILAQACEGAGHRHRARLLWLDLARADGDAGDGRHMWKLGRDAFRRGDHAEAERALAAYLAVAPGDLAAAEMLFEARLATADASGQEAIWERHSAEWPVTSLSLAVLAGAMARSGSDTKRNTQAVLRRALGKWKGAVDAALRIAACHESLGEPRDALAVLDRALAVHPTDTSLHRARLRALAAAGTPKADLLAAADKLLALDPDKAHHHLLRARLLAGYKDWSGAAAAWRRALDLDPSAVEHWRGLLVALANLERNAAVEALLAEARAHFRGRGPDAAVDLAALENAGGHHDRAAALAAGALSNPRVRARARETAAAALLDAGQYVRAWSYLSASVQEGTAPLGTRRMAARCAAALRLPAPGGGVPSFPATLFERALLHPPPGRSLIEPGPGVMLVTSSLGAGGAERQVALSAAGAARLRAAAGRGPTVLVGQDLSADRGRAVMLPVARTPELLIEDLGPVDDAAAFRAIAAADPGAREALRLIAALPPRIARDVLKFYDCFRRHRPGLVHLWQDGVISSGSVAAVLAGVPRIVGSFRNVVATETDRRRFRAWLFSLYRALARRPDTRFTANSAAGAADYERWLDLRAGTVSVIRNGIEVAAVRGRASAADRQAARDALGVGPDELLVGGTFRLAPAKRPHLWLSVAERVAAAVPRSRFVIVGDGVLRAELEARIASRGLSGRVALAGRKSPVEPWIAAMDAMLLASEVEGLPNVLLEAQALGVPVVTTDAGGSAEAVLDGITGVLVPEDDADRLAEAVARVLQDGSIRARARVGAPAFIEQRFGVRRMLSDTLALYDATTPDGRSAA